MSGGKGGSTTSEVKIPEYIEAAAQRNLNKAERISQLGYVPHYGPDVAAFSPMQQAGFQNTANMAGAFGMAAPTSQQDIMGGMPAPTQYAGGVSGYSSAPLYQQSIDALAAARPAQKSYIDSFFIDPTSGQYAYQPMDYTKYTTNAANDRAAAAAAAAAAADYGGRDMDYGGNAGGGGVGYTGVRDMFDGGGPNASTIGGRAFAGPNPDGSAGNDGGGDKVICTALHELGRLSDEMYALDAEFGLRVNREDPMLGDGYRLWATSVANYIKGDSIGSKVALAIVSPVATAWAAEMAHVMRPSEYKSNIFGKALMAVGHPICRMVGKVFLPKMNKEAV